MKNPSIKIMVIKFFTKTYLNQQNTNREKREPHTSGHCLVVSNKTFEKVKTWIFAQLLLSRLSGGETINWPG